LTLKERIGQLVMVGFDGETPSSGVARLIKKYHVGGIILFSRNIKTPHQSADLTQSLQHLSKTIPLLIAVDQEGGRVARLPLPHTQFPPAGVLGVCDSTALTHRSASAMAKELRVIGINMDFSPVLDVRTNPKNKVIGDRSFGICPERVVNHGLAVIAGLQDNKVIACGKHFPGHGDTTEDSHEVLPEVAQAYDRLMEVELVPFVHAVENNVASLMTAHVCYTCLDKERPASLSTDIVTGLLRKTIHFEGVVISDDLEMKGITHRFTVAEAAVMAILAGSDIVLICHSEEQQIAALEALIHAVEKGVVSKERLNASLNRILHLKEKFLIPRVQLSPADIQEWVGCAAHRAVVDEIYQVARANVKGLLDG